MLLRVFLILLLVKTLSRVFYRLDMEWIGGARPITFTQPQLLMITVTLVGVPG